MTRETAAGDVTVIVVELASGDPLDVSDRLKQQHAPAAVIVGARNDGAAQLLINLDKSLEGRGVNAGDVIREAAVLIGGKGGGRPTMARAGGKEPQHLDDAVALAEKTIIEALGYDDEGARARLRRRADRRGCPTEPGRAADEDRAALHAFHAAAIGRADLPAGVAGDADGPPSISAPTQSEALPLTSIWPPFMYAPRCMPALPTTRMLPRVMPRPIHFTLPSVPPYLHLLARLAFDLEEILQPALPLAQEHRQGAERLVGAGWPSRRARRPPPPRGRWAVL